ncbi:MAG: tyrosine phosphatase family protein [Pseudomonadota bacterium]|jgi:predicted protein tyrosine phosphatase|nr:tyrosine protein phosphatase [Alphaproteobacteria bacterium]
MLYICPLSQLYSAIDRHSPSHLVSLLDPHSMIDTPRVLKSERHLRLSINDITTPREGLTVPAEAHIRELLTFLDSWDRNAPMLIHCWAGISRSTAAAYIALCHLNEVDEFQAARLLRARARHAQPNRLLVALADKLMSRQGRMIEAVEEIGPGVFDMEGALFSLPAKL